MLIIDFYKTDNDRRVLNKTLTKIGDSHGARWQLPSTILNPTIIVDIFNGWETANYCYLSETDRYYFINNITLLQGGMLQIDLSVDVLYTYRNSIKNLTVLVKRSESIANSQIVDNERILQNNLSIIDKKMGNAVATGYNIYLTTNA